MVNRLRVAGGPWVSKLRLCKRDAHHYFHMLKIGPKWAKYMAHPPNESSHGILLYPCQRIIPMGFTAAASWAQGIAEYVVADADLPPDQRLIEGQPLLSISRVWGSILDDVWCIASAPLKSDRVGEQLLEQVERSWHDIGVEVNAKKNVDDAVLVEVQGAFVHGSELWCGVSQDKRLMLMQAGVRLLSRPYMDVKTLECWVGKAGFVTMFRSPTRCILYHIYRWLDGLRRADVKKSA